MKIEWPNEIANSSDRVVEKGINKNWFTHLGKIVTFLHYIETDLAPHKKNVTSYVLIWNSLGLFTGFMFTTVVYDFLFSWQAKGGLWSMIQLYRFQSFNHMISTPCDEQQQNRYFWLLSHLRSFNLLSSSLFTSPLLHSDTVLFPFRLNCDVNKSKSWEFVRTYGKHGKFGGEYSIWSIALFNTILSGFREKEGRTHVSRLKFRLWTGKAEEG